MATFHITLSESLHQFVTEQIAEKGLDHSDQYFEQLVEAEQRKVSKSITGKKFKRDLPADRRSALRPASGTRWLTKLNAELPNVKGRLPNDAFHCSPRKRYEIVLCVPCVLCGKYSFLTAKYAKSAEKDLIRLCFVII